MDREIDIMRVLQGLTGLAGLACLLGMLYFGFVLVRVRGGRCERVFFWCAVCQLAGGGLATLLSVLTGMELLPFFLFEGGGVNWAWVASSIFKGLVLLSALVGTGALVASSR